MPHSTLQAEILEVYSIVCLQSPVIKCGSSPAGWGDQPYMWFMSLPMGHALWFATAGEGRVDLVPVLNTSSSSCQAPCDFDR
jgi:hypothetical protein